MNIPNPHLQALRTTLEDLLVQRLPPPVRAALDQALDQLDTYEQSARPANQQDRLAALYQVSQSLGTSLNLDEVLNQVVEAVIALTGAERGFLLLQDAATGALLLRAGRTSQGQDLAQDEPNLQNLSISQTVLRTALESGEGVLTTNAQDDPRFSTRVSVVMFALRSVMCAPLRSRGQTIGVIYVDNRAKAGTFNEADLDLLKTFAAQAAIAIDNAQLFTQTGQDLADRIGELEILSKVNQELNASLDFQTILHTSLSWALQVTGSETGWIALSSRDNPSLMRVAGPGAGQILDPVPSIVAQALTESVLKAGPPNGGSPAMLAAPLRMADETFGVLVVESPEPYPENRQAYLLRLADRAASAIQNGRLFQDVQKANEAKSKFVSLVSHELRLPMTSIKGYTDLILQGMVGEISAQQREFLTVIKNNVTRMTTLVSDLSDVNRIESGRLKLELKPFSITRQAEDVINSLAPKIAERQQTLTLHTAENLPDAHTDPNRYAQVLTNLVSNANKYTPPGGAITVSITLDDQGMLRTTVTDTGIGIAPEDQPKIFEQFFRSEDSAVRDQQGWGLGLNVVRNLVELMGGEVQFSSQPGQGSTFWFSVPAV